MDSDNLNDAGPEEGQPEIEAVAEAPASESAPEGQAEASAEETTSQPTRLYANKFKADTELEQGYLNLERKLHEVTGELSAYKKVAQPAQPAPQQSALKEAEDNRNKWAQYAASPGLSEDQRAHAWNQVSLHDRKIAKMEALEEFQSLSTKQSASKDLEADALAVFQTYQADLSPGSSLYQAAEARYLQMVRAGYPDSTSTKADAVLWAAHKTGVSKSKAISTDRKDFLGNLNKQAKAAVKAGAGTATTVKAGGLTVQQLNAMDDAAFAKWERENVLGA
jgi:hypothetical protein